MKHPLLQSQPNAPLELQVEAEDPGDGISFQWISVFSHFIGSFPLRMRFGFARPEGSGPFPALLHLHGGAQCASREVAMAWARQGYATLCPDWSGPAGHTHPAFPTQWPTGFPAIADTSPDPEHAAVRHVVLGVRRGLDFLCAHPQIDANRIGMVGISWGGFMTWLVNGVDQRLRCAVPVFGCGLADPFSPSPAWRAAFQPEQFADTQHAPVFHLNGTHDFFGQLHTAEALLKKLRVPHWRLYVPNEDHGLSSEARESVHAWLHTWLQTDRSPPPEPDIEDPEGVRHHAASSDRRSVFRKWSTPGLPKLGSHFVTRSFPGGFHFSSAVRRLPDAERGPGVLLYDPATDGAEPLFLRWEYNNLRVHLPGTADWVRSESGGIQLDPPCAGLSCCVRVDTPPPSGMRAVLLRMGLPGPGKLELTIFNGTTLEESFRWTHPVQTAPAGNPVELLFPLDQFSGSGILRPEEICILKLMFQSEAPDPSPVQLLQIAWS